MASLATCDISEDVFHAELLNVHPLVVEEVLTPTPEPIVFENDRVPPGPPEEPDGDIGGDGGNTIVSDNNDSGAASSGVGVESEPAPATTGIPWDALATCESGYGGGPTWDINTGNGYYGGLQFDKPSWDWAGGQQYAEYPHHATREQQIAVAEQLLSIHPAGIGAWPACADSLGLR